MIVYFFESITAFMSVFFFLQFVIIRRKDHLFYALFLLALSVYFVVALPWFFFEEAKQEAVAHSFDIFKRPVQYLSSVFYTFFVMHYLGLQYKSPYLYKIFRILTAVYIISASLCLVLNYMNVNYDKAYYIFSSLLFPVQIFVVAALFRNQVPYAKYVILGSIITLLGSCFSLMLSIYASNHPSVSFGNVFTVFIPVQISITLDIFLFTIALQKKIADNEKALISTAFQRQQAIMLERERIIADLHDDVGGGISSIRMMSDLMAQQDTAAQQGGFPQKISQTAREIAQRMNTIIWSLNEENDTLGNLVEYVRQYGLSYFENSGIQFNFRGTDPMYAPMQLTGVQRKNLFLVIKESMHNILKHAGATVVNVEISVNSNRLSVLIHDNGRGIPAPSTEGNHFGNGLKNMTKRMTEINGTIQIDNAAGTKIVLETMLR
jgi:signal transduction histidine kinase